MQKSRKNDRTNCTATRAATTSIPEVGQRPGITCAIVQPLARSHPLPPLPRRFSLCRCRRRHRCPRLCSVYIYNIIGSCLLQCRSGKLLKNKIRSDYNGPLTTTNINHSTILHYIIRTWFPLLLWTLYSCLPPCKSNRLLHSGRCPSRAAMLTLTGLVSTRSLTTTILRSEFIGPVTLQEFHANQQTNR